MNKQPNNNNKTTLDECVLCKLYYNDQKEDEDEDEDEESRKRKRFTTSTTTEEDQKEEDNKNNDPLSLSQQHESNPPNPNPNPNLSVEEWESYFNITLDQHLEEEDEDDDDDDTLFFNQLNQADYPPQHYFDDPPYNLAPQQQLHNHNEIDNHIENLLQLLNDNSFSNGVQINALLLFCCCFKGTIFKKIFKLGCKPNAVTFGTLINGLCRTGNASIALELHKQMACGKDHGDGFKCTPNLVWYGAIIDGLCKEGLMEKAQQLFLEMKEKGVRPDVVVYSSLMHGLCYADKWEEAKALFSEMTDQDVQPNGIDLHELDVCYVPSIEQVG
ncbi:hypothetical protein CsatA_003249 [Cannabis sativa]